MDGFWFDLCFPFYHCASLRTFRAIFGCEPIVCTEVFIKYGEYISKPLHLLWVLNFLKEYTTVHSLAAKWDVCTSVFSNTVWSTLQRLSLQMKGEVSFTIRLILKKKVQLLVF